MTAMTPGQYHNIMDRLENVKFEALRFAGVPDIPKEYDENDGVWLRAIAKVITNTAIHSYAIVENNGLGAVKFVKVFDTYGISRIESIHPYMFANAKSVEKSPDALELKDELAKAQKISNHKDCAFAYRDHVKTAMDQLRKPADSLEVITDKEYWPIPTYGDLLFEV